jgi:hypothetical protein
MHDIFTLEAFTPRVGAAFRIAVGDGTHLDVRLTTVEPLASAAGGSRTPFALTFHGPREIVLPQQTYRIESEGMEPMDVFLVPIGPDQHGMAYEAIFT